MKAKPAISATLSDFPSGIPSRGLVLVFGEPMSGKDACVGNAILRESVKRKFEVILVSESQLFFGRPQVGEANRAITSEADLGALMERYLVVLITQRVENFPVDFRNFIFTHADAIFVLRSRDKQICDFVMKRARKKWSFITAHLPSPSGYVTARDTRRFAEVAVCTRRRELTEALPVDRWDRVRLLRLPIVVMDSSPVSPLLKLRRTNQ